MTSARPRCPSERPASPSQKKDEMVIDLKPPTGANTGPPKQPSPATAMPGKSLATDVSMALRVVPG